MLGIAEGVHGVDTGRSFVGTWWKRVLMEKGVVDMISGDLGLAGGARKQQGTTKTGQPSPMAMPSHHEEVSCGKGLNGLPGFFRRRNGKFSRCP